MAIFSFFTLGLSLTNVSFKMIKIYYGNKIYTNIMYHKTCVFINLREIIKLLIGISVSILEGYGGEGGGE